MWKNMFLSALLYWCVSCAALYRKSSADGGWPGHFIPAAPLHPGVLHQALPPRTSPTSLQWVSASLYVFVIEFLLPRGPTKSRCTFIAQNRQSVKFPALLREQHAAARAKLSPGLRSQRWIYSFSKPCAKRMIAILKRYEPHALLPTDRLSLNLWHNYNFTNYVCCPIFCLQVKNVYQTSFSAFLDSLDLSGAMHFPQVGGVDCPNACVTVCLALRLRFHCWSHSAACCHHRTSVWQLLAAPPTHTHFLPACFHIIWCQENVCTGRGLFWRVNSTLQSWPRNSGDRTLLFAYTETLHWHICLMATSPQQQAGVYFICTGAVWILCRSHQVGLFCCKSMERLMEIHLHYISYQCVIRL